MTFPLFPWQTQWRIWRRDEAEVEPWTQGSLKGTPIPTLVFTLALASQWWYLLCTEKKHIFLTFNLIRGEFNLKEMRTARLKQENHATGAFEVHESHWPKHPINFIQTVDVSSYILHCPLSVSPTFSTNRLQMPFVLLLLLCSSCSVFCVSQVLPYHWRPPDDYGSTVDNPTPLC